MNDGDIATLFGLDAGDVAILIALAAGLIAWFARRRMRTRGAARPGPVTSSDAGVFRPSAGTTRSARVFTTARTRVSVDAPVQVDGLDDLGQVVREALGPDMAELVERALADGKLGPLDRSDVVIDGKLRAVNGGDAASRLLELQSLRDQGLISAAEYDTKRAQVIDGL